MKDTLKQSLIDPFKENDKGMIILSMLLWILMLMILAIVIITITQGVNRIGRQEQNAIGTIKNKYFEPAHIEHHAKTSRRVPDRWWVSIQKNNIEDKLQVGHQYYIDHKIGDKICYRYYTGRLYESLYIVSFCK